MQYDLLIIGGGAAGFFCAANIKEFAPEANVLLIEKSPNFLGKVKISGGGRCNVTHACFNPKELSKFYPRGEKELIGPFNQFQPGDTFSWFEERGIELKIEKDNRVFPASNTSQTIINCLVDSCKKNDITTTLQCAVSDLKQQENGNWLVETNRGSFESKTLLLASGSSPQMLSLLNKIGLKTVPSVPSLFTFNIKNALINELSGISFPNAQIEIPSLKMEEFGPLLITHWGLSGPAVLKLSAWGARVFHKVGYNFTIKVNFNTAYSEDDAFELLVDQKNNFPKKTIEKNRLFDLPQRFWSNMIQVCGLQNLNYADASNKQLRLLAQHCCSATLQVQGKSTFKDEFVTAGGIALETVNFKNYESKTHPGLYFAGEVLDIDAVTGGFNFQAAWTSAYIAAKGIAERVQSSSL